MTSQPTTVEVWLVRHGRTAWNAAGRFQGWRDVPLDEVGQAQARALAPVFADVDVDEVWSSDLDRAVATARAALRPPRVDPRLRELDFGTMEGATWDELDEDVQQQLLADDHAGFVAPGGESVTSLRARLSAFLDELEPGCHVVVTHGGVVQSVLGMCGATAVPANAEVLRVDWSTRTVLPTPVRHDVDRHDDEHNDDHDDERDRER